MRNKQQVYDTPNGRFITQAIEAVEDDVIRSPQRIGDSYITSGYGSPEGRVTGAVGDLFLRRDGSTNTTLYVKETWTQARPTLGWKAK